MNFRKTIQSTLFLAMIWFIAGNRYTLSQNKLSEKNPIAACIAYYNVENLFDTINQSGSADIEFTPQGSSSWNTPEYFEKPDRLAEVISMPGTELTPDGPAIVGLSEIENETVFMNLLCQERTRNRNYQVIFIKVRDVRVIHSVVMATACTWLVSAIISQPAFFYSRT